MAVRRMNELWKSMPLALMFGLLLLRGPHGGAVGSTHSLTARRSLVRASAGSVGISVWSLHVLPVLVWVSFGCSGFPHSPKTCDTGDTEQILSASAEKAMVCETGSASLICDLGYINILDANYGRTDPVTCSNGKSPKEILNVYCFQETALRTMSTWCNGKQKCSVPAENWVFSDPCSDTYKYLNVTYECRTLKQSITCENTQSVIDCGKYAVIDVHHANYGKRDVDFCSSKPTTNPNCLFTQTYSLRARCNGKGSCHLDASNTVYSDPCSKVHKYLEVTYSCLKICE